MTLLTKLLIGFLALILIGVVYRAYFPVAKPYPASQIVAAPIVDEAIAIGIDLPAGQIVTPDTIKNGRYPLLALRITGNKYILNVVNRIGPLWTLDKNQDDVINNTDPVYSQLALAYINPKDKTVRLVPLSTAGIQAIIVDPDPAHHLKAAEESQGLPAGYWHVHSQVVMADGSIWLTHHIPLSTSYLDSFKTAPDSNQTIIPAGQ